MQLKCPSCTILARLARCAARGRNCFTSVGVTCVACAGDGTTDDTAALQRAIAELTADGQPGVLVIEPGTYVLTAMINVSAPIVLRGAGIETTTLFFPKSLSEVAARATRPPQSVAAVIACSVMRNRLSCKLDVHGMVCRAP